MDELSGEEAMVLVLSAVLAGWLGVRFVTAIMTTDPRAASLWVRLTLVITPFCCLFGVHYVLVHWAEAQVREHGIYTLLFLLLGAAWLGIVIELLPLLGLSFRDDALGRANPAAMLTVCGAMIGTSLCYAGSNIGGGETIWSTILPALLATGTLLALWFMMEITSSMADAITIDRDTASALRLAGWLTAAGAILGRAMAGDYLSAEATLRDFARQGWPAGVLALAAIAMQFAFRPSPRRPKGVIILNGVIPALGQLGLASAWIAWLGSWTEIGGGR